MEHEVMGPKLTKAEGFILGIEPQKGLPIWQALTL